MKKHEFTKEDILTAIIYINSVQGDKAFNYLNKMLNMAYRDGEINQLNISIDRNKTL